MEDVSLWLRELTAATVRLFGQFVEFLPNLFGALLLLGLGWFAARILRALTEKAGEGINRLLDSSALASRGHRLQLSPATVGLIGNVVFWVVIIFAVTLATKTLGLELFTEWLSRIVGYLPTLFAGGLIVLVGVLVSVLARDLTVRAMESAGVGRAEVFGRIAQAAVLVTALIIGIDQIGIDVTLLVTLVSIFVGAAAGSLALAFALGARSFIANLIGAHYLHRQYRIGQTVRFGEIEGRIAELTSTAVIVDGSDGRATIPAHVFHDAVSVLIDPDDGNA